jgi:hypothetical protein|tara:strand:- start:1361 stop:1732 length:372 start_codon:yes stop_codon:yes gene_type:complete
MDPSKFRSETDSVLEGCARNLELVSEKVANSLSVFPGFLNMETVQAIEIEPFKDGPDRGCVVICPDGHLYEFVLEILSGPDSVGGYQHSDNLKELDLSNIEKIVYLERGIQLMLCLDDKAVGS